MAFALFFGGRTVCELIRYELGRVEGAKLSELQLLLSRLVPEFLRSLSKLILHLRWSFKDKKESLLSAVFAIELADLEPSNVLHFSGMLETDVPLRSDKFRLTIDDLLSYNFPSDCFRLSVKHSVRCCEFSEDKLDFRSWSVHLIMFIFAKS